MNGKVAAVKSVLAARMSKKPSAGMSTQAKGNAVKEAKEGKDMGDSGKNFGKIAASAGKEYGSAAAGKKVAGAIFWKKMGKK